MGMLRPGIYFELAPEHSPESILRQHTFHGELDDPLGVSLDHAPERYVLLITHISGVAEVRLLIRLFARQADLFGIDDDDVVTRIEMRSVHRLMLATKDACDLGGEPTERLIRRIDEPPMVLDVRGFWCIRSHARVLQEGAT